MSEQVSKAALRRGQKAVEKKNAVLQRLVTEYVPVDSIRPNSYNPNRQDERDFELLLRSMREDGFTQPIVVHRPTGEIVDGEHRWRAARELGMAEIPVVFVDMTPEQMRIATLRHNRARGSEDSELSSQLLRDLRELGALDWAQDSLMIDDAELQKLIDDVKAPADLAGAAFGTAWVPTKNADGMATRDAEREAVDFTPEAKVQQHEYERRLAAAPSEDVRVKLEVEMRQDTYRLTLVYAGEEAELLRRILEPNPAVKVLALCLARQAVAAKEVGDGEA